MKKMVKKIFVMVQDIPSNMNFIGQFEVVQSNKYSYKVVELSV